MDCRTEGTLDHNFPDRKLWKHWPKQSECFFQRPRASKDYFPISNFKPNAGKPRCSDNLISWSSMQHCPHAWKKSSMCIPFQITGTVELLSFMLLWSFVTRSNTFIVHSFLPCALRCAHRSGSSSNIFKHLTRPRNFFVPNSGQTEQTSEPPYFSQVTGAHQSWCHSVAMTCRKPPGFES